MRAAAATSTLYKVMIDACDVVVVFSTAYIAHNKKAKRVESSE